MLTRMGSSDQWILAVVDALNRNGSWTGRIHIHKLLFITKTLKQADPPFEFELYAYGPYSFVLDEEIAELEMFGLLERTYRQAGYGPRYRAAVDVTAPNFGGDQVDCQAIERVAKALGSRNSSELELIATCLWARREEALSEREACIARTREIKPKYTPDQVEVAYAQALAIEAELVPGT